MGKLHACDGEMRTVQGLKNYIGHICREHGISMPPLPQH